MRPTFITGFVRIGDAFRQVTIRREIDDKLTKGSGLVKIVWRYVATTKSGAAVDPWAVEWRTIRTVRNAAAVRIHGDGRLSAAGPSMFAFSARALTKRDGTLAAGGAYDFPGFVEHMLIVGGEGVWHGEGVEDRTAQAVDVLTQAAWPTVGDDWD